MFARIASVGVLVLSAGIAAAQDFPVTVEHIYGETVIPAEPQRVVSIGFQEQDFLYALGVAPVGVRDWWGGYPYATWPWAETARAAVGATPEVLEGYETNIEWVAALQPDLIVAVYFDLDQTTYDLLSQIAPVVVNPVGYPVWGAPWQAELTLLDQATSGNTTKSEAIIADIEAQFAAAREAHPDLAGHTATNAYLQDDGTFTVYGDKDIASRFLTNFGMEFPAPLMEFADEAGTISISAENAELLDIDVMVWPVDQGLEERRQQIEGLSVYQNLRLAKEGRSVWLDDEGGISAAALAFQTPLSIAYLTGILPPLLSAALDGDPATPAALSEQ